MKDVFFACVISSKVSLSSACQKPVLGTTSHIQPTFYKATRKQKKFSLINRWCQNT